MISVVQRLPARVIVHSQDSGQGRHRTSAFAKEEARLNPEPRLSVATLVLHGGADTCNHPDSSSGREPYFRGRYKRFCRQDCAEVFRPGRRCRRT